MIEAAVRPTRRTPWVAALAFLLFGLAQVSAVMHSGVRHVQCAEHPGEWVEAVVGVASGHANPNVDSVDAGVDGPAHEHCVFACLELAPAPHVDRIDARNDVATSVAVAESALVVAADEKVSLAVLGTAPKTSPPSS